MKVKEDHRMTTVNEPKNNWSGLEYTTSSKRDVSKNIKVTDYLRT